MASCRAGLDAARQLATGRGRLDVDGPGRAAWFEGGTVSFGDATGRRPEQLPDGMADHLS
ncbi:hypothetical protein [Actinomadura sp. K4S16]|uniref:hypothetical protein n=1 Tax=Actinomadura sp. K4S16 TaxID=1316147 RepID=UPI0011ED3AA6|nr:hypothetical protein [Actinomadura sp. K4S16]